MLTDIQKNGLTADIAICYVQYVSIGLVMAALCNRAGHYIFALWFLSICIFPRLISAATDWMSTILRHMVWP